MLFFFSHANNDVIIEVFAFFLFFFSISTGRPRRSLRISGRALETVTEQRSLQSSANCCLIVRR